MEAAGARAMLKLPELVLFQNYQNDWATYEEALYSFFKTDFILSQPKYMNENVRTKKHPKFKNKESCFWHITSEGKIESERTPDFRKCERIRWPRPIIDNHNHDSLKIWQNERNGNKNICICYGDWEYLVVLTERKGYVLFWTAYPIEHEHNKRKLKKEFDLYIANIASV